MALASTRNPGQHHGSHGSATRMGAKAWVMLDHPAERAYAVAVTATTGGWLTAATAIGPITPPMPATAIALTVACGIPWWANRRRRAKVRRGSPLTVETSVVVIMASTGWPCCARLAAGQATGLPAFPVPRGRSGLRGQGRPAGPSPEGRCAAPLRPEERPRTLSGRKKDSGGAAASFSRPAQRARRGHAASLPARKRS